MTECIGVRLLRMGFVSLTCPKCGAPVELDESREYGFCQFCGTKITQEKVVVEHRGSVAVNHAEEISNCLRRAEDLYQRGSTLEAEFYYDRVLSMDPENPLAKSRMEALYRIIRDPNVTVELEIGRFFNKNTALTIRIDKKDLGRSPVTMSAHSLHLSGSIWCISGSREFSFPPKSLRSTLRIGLPDTIFM